MDPLKREQRLRSCRLQPREYLFTYTIPNANQTVANLGQALDQDADFFLREIVPIPLNNSGYRVQLFDPAIMPLEDSVVDPWYRVLDPAVRYPAGGKILITLQDITGGPGTVATLLLRGVNEYSHYRETPEDRRPCLTVPKTFYLQVNFIGSPTLNDQIVYLDQDAEFELRQVTAVNLNYQFADRDQSFIQNGLVPVFPGQNLYDPGIRYPRGGRIVANVQGLGAAGFPTTGTLAFTGVNRYHVEPVE